MWYTSTGVITYDPYRPNMKNRTDWWCVVPVSNTITEYYRWWLQQNYCLKNLKAPAWDAHISVVRGEMPTDDKMYLWRKYEGQKVEFKYSGNVEQGNRPNFWQVEVDCPFLTNIRKEFGLLYDWPLHITVGKVYE